MFDFVPSSRAESPHAPTSVEPDACVLYWMKQTDCCATATYNSFVINRLTSPIIFICRGLFRYYLAAQPGCGDLCGGIEDCSSEPCSDTGREDLTMLAIRQGAQNYLQKEHLDTFWILRTLRDAIAAGMAVGAILIGK